MREENKKKSTSKIIKENKIPRNKFTQGGKRLSPENYKTLLKEIKDINKWKTSFNHGLEDNIIEMIILHKGIYIFNTISTKNPKKFFAEIKNPF